jgi:Mycotoxin biosynthesis protein UstYa
MAFNFFSARSKSRTPLETKETYADDTESLLSHDNTLHSDSLSIDSNNTRRWPALSLTFVLLGSHLVTAIASGWVATHWRPFSADSFCARHTSHYSPVVNEVDIKYSMVDYNGSFFHQTIYRGDPSPEVDAAWEALGVDYRALAVPEADALKSGIEPDQVRIRAKYGGGYPANVEGLHHLHCLNLLRQSSLYNFDYYKALGKGAFKNEDHIVKVHISKYSQLSIFCRVFLFKMFSVVVYISHLGVSLLLSFIYSHMLT